MLTKSKWNRHIIRSLRNVTACFAFSLNKQAQPNSATPTIVKLNRKKVSGPVLTQVEPQYAGKEEHMSTAEAAYQESIRLKIEENAATRNFYNYELERGEDLIDKVPVNPYYEYKMGDLKLEMEARQKLVDNLKGVKVFADPRKYEKLKSLVLGYETIKHRYQMQQFLKKLAEYPGSVKGPNPEDDPVVYSQYVHRIIPEWILNEIKSNSKQSTSTIGEDKQQTYFGKQHITDKLQYEPKYTPPEEGNLQPEEDLQFISEKGGNTVRYSAIPIYPYTKFEEYHSYISKLRMWNEFKRYHQKVNQGKNLNKLVQLIDELEESRKKKVIATLGKQPEFTPTKIPARQLKNLSEKQKKLKQKAVARADKRKKKQMAHQRRMKIQGFQFEPKIYSLYTYYKTLPKEIQEDPRVRTVYLGLEYSSPDATYQEKEQTLNKAAKMSLPMDKFSTAAMEKLLEKTRSYLTPHLVDRIFNISPEFTWDMHQFLTEVKDEKLRSISTVKEKELSFIEPPELQTRSDEGMANLPVDYYDNEDGFWTDYIDQKLKRYQKVQPLSKKPKSHFIH